MFYMMLRLNASTQMIDGTTSNVVVQRYMDSAGGSAAMARNRQNQAIYSLKGKPLNSWECDQSKIFSNAELSDLTCAIGTGLFSSEMTNEEIDAAMTKLRYNKIIIMADADIDGSHIECLLLGYLFRHCRPLIEHGHVYIALPPLFRVTEKGKHTFLKDEAALSTFFKKRAKAIVGSDSLLLALAGGGLSIASQLETLAGATGMAPSDIAHALRATATYDKGREDWLMAYAERVVEIRESECEGVSASEVDGGAIIVSGLEASGRYFTSVIDEVFFHTAEQAWDAVCAVVGSDAALGLVQRDTFTVGNVTCSDLYTAAKEIEKASRKGVNVQRNKGLAY